MKKLLTILGVLLVLVILVVVIATFALGSIVRTGVNRLGPQVTQTPVTLEDAELSAFSGNGTLRGLTVGNPEGWSGEQAFTLEEVTFSVEPRSLLGDEPIVIRELVVQRPEFNVEQRLTGGSNLKDLIENIQKAVGSRPATIGEPEEPPRKFIIHKLRLLDGAVHVGVAGAALDVPLPELSYDNLGVQEGGLTPAQLANVVLTDVLGRVISTATQSGVLSGRAGETLDAIGNALKGSGGSLQKLLGGKKEAPKEQPKQ